jgi:2-iminobutanoate/2-iminopropanoate deaminase
MKKIHSTEKAPKAIGPYSQAVQANGFLFISGQLPLNPEDGSMPDTITDQAHQSLKNLDAILKEAGLTLQNVVKTTMFLADMNEFAEANNVYMKYFTEGFPARSTVQVARLPKDARVEIEAVAVYGVSI